MQFLITIYFLWTLAMVVDTTNYCPAKLCKSGKKHIACNNKGTFASVCGAGARMVDLTSHIDAILNIHNTMRNQIASGKLSGYKPAKRMATMQWDKELAAMAALNVKQCAMKHDQCRNTNAFSKSGQNLAFYSNSGQRGSRTDTWLLKNRINAWWNEYKIANMAHIDKYPNGYSGPQIGHFTVMVAEKNTHVGCAAVRFASTITMNTFLIACNYATTNIIGRPLYAAGATASGCTTGKNAEFSGLCSKQEAYAGL